MHAHLRLATLALALAALPAFAQDALPPAPASPPPSVVTPTAPLPQPSGRLDFHQRFKIALESTFSPTVVVFSAAEAGIDIAHPPHDYPREWRDGGGAIARNFGAELNRHVAGGLTRFAVAAIDREDPRYFPSTHTPAGRRLFHALAYTLYDRTDSGRHIPAVRNFAGAAAAGFIGMPYEPDGYDDSAHALQRAAWEFSSYGSHNLLAEFSPELFHLMRKAHLPAKLANILVTENHTPKP